MEDEEKARNLKERTKKDAEKFWKTVHAMVDMGLLRIVPDDPRGKIFQETEKGAGTFKRAIRNHGKDADKVLAEFSH